MHWFHKSANYRITFFEKNRFLVHKFRIPLLQITDFELISQITVFSFRFVSQFTVSPLRDNNKKTSIFRNDTDTKRNLFPISETVKVDKWLLTITAGQIKLIHKKEKSWIVQIKLKSVGCGEISNDFFNLHLIQYLEYQLSPTPSWVINGPESKVPKNYVKNSVTIQPLVIFNAMKIVLYQ